MFIPEVKWGKTNDREECRKLAGVLAKEIADTFGGNVDKFTAIVDEILDMSFNLSTAYDLIVKHGADLDEKILLATYGYMAITGKICTSDIPFGAMARLSNAIFKSVAFRDIVPMAKAHADDIFRHIG